ncbi:glutathione S-transferase C-terminal domain-containing protein [Streptomyces sp. P38-E01]|uniref:Glutathione S-transferase C-terminal domain-containing protein n=1 Tax=Streptomyces tardus TaxID=2780544 RepID=A0A949NAJ4_9ACTN|nr:glutathione S-transferase C-terminal domain-containing protein [Streptomyces tardus]MBU7600726.1 glutathione S-transferase C-terminal domain-containing protein [Streptomyces tardus]
MSGKNAPAPTTPGFTGRLGDARSGGFYPVPQRYGLHLALSCPSGLRIAIAHALLRLEGRVALHLLPPVPGEGGDHPELRAWYQASRHGHPGPYTAPLLTDAWTGRIVSDRPGDIVTDLATHYGGARELLPVDASQRSRAQELSDLFDRDIGEAAGEAGEARSGAAEALERLLAALGSLEALLERRPYVLGERLTTVDVHLWTTLVRLDHVDRWHLDARATHRIAAHPQLWAYARRLLALPEFGQQLRTSDILSRHHVHCRGLEAAGAAVRIIDWQRPAPLPESCTEQRSNVAAGCRRL